MACFRVDADQQNWHLKVPSLSEDSLAYEVEMASWAGQAGMGPAVTTLANGVNALAAALLPVKALRPRTLLTGTIRYEVFNTLRVIHAACAPSFVKNAHDILYGPELAYQDCVKMGASQDLPAIWHYVLHLGYALKKEEKPHRFCHGDFHLGNLLHYRQKVWVVDWSSAHCGDPYRDLGRFATLSGLELGDAPAVLAEYQGAHTDADVLHLQRYIALFDADYALYFRTHAEFRDYVSYFQSRVCRGRQVIGEGLMKL